MIDKCQITVQSGKGGDGIIAFDKFKKADGGDGGKGGDVYIVGDTNVYDLAKLLALGKFKAGDGENGQKNKRKGRDGEDIEIHLPLVTKIYNEDGTEFLTISKSGYKVKILDGGKGGLGNFSLRGKSWDGKFSRTEGEKSKTRKLKLELNLKSDVIFLGLPNAGKSSIVNALSNAKYKVAPYEFTTLNPQLAVMNGYMLMDLPGLIEGAHKGKGLGTEFLKHTRYAKLLVHCISLENDNIKEVYKDMRKEFLNISEDLYSLPEFVLFTKADIYSTEQLKEKIEELKKEFPNSLAISVYRKEDLELLRNELKKRLSSVSRSTI
ncbi:MAG TPA: 50S ribosome-binding GTPase [Candidatus Dojkabacteria bacterium]|mgnify:FL=1|nr:50S ribosome-binding GTPase [Candidatus Dojkabacteria bacterium]